MNKITYLALFLALCIASQLGASERITVGDRTFHLPDHWKVDRTAKNELTATPPATSGYRMKKMRFSHEDTENTLDDIYSSFRRNLDRNHILKEGTDGWYKHDTKWIVFKSTDESPVATMKFFAVVENQQFTFEFLLPGQAWESCIPQAIKIAQTLR